MILFVFVQASICRSSQPLSGFSARSTEDEQMMQAIMKSNPASEFMYVVDTRPKVNYTCFLTICACLSVCLCVCVYKPGYCKSA